MKPRPVGKPTILRAPAGAASGTALTAPREAQFFPADSDKKKNKNKKRPVSTSFIFRCAITKVFIAASEQLH